MIEPGKWFARAWSFGLPVAQFPNVLERLRGTPARAASLVARAPEGALSARNGRSWSAKEHIAHLDDLHELDETRLAEFLARAPVLAAADIEIGPLRIDTRASRVTLSGNPVKLTSQEYRLLAYLAHHRGKVVSRTELVEHLYDQDFDRDSNTIEVFVGRLRKKLDANLIQTVRGLGYSLDAPVEAK